MSKKILMHANDKVLAFTENQKGYVEEVTEVYNKPLLPFQCGHPNYYPFKLQQWLMESKTSLNREEINNLFYFYGKDFINPPNFISLLNNYWIRADKDILTTWDNVNAYDNWNESEDSINILVHNPSLIQENIPITFNSPNMTLPGQKERYWHKEGNRFFLLETKIRKTEYPIIIYEQKLFTKRAIPYISKDFEFMPLTFYTESIEGDNLSELERIQSAASKYQLDKTKIMMLHLQDTYVVREAKSLNVVDVFIL